MNAQLHLGAIVVCSLCAQCLGGDGDAATDRQALQEKRRMLWETRDDLQVRIEGSVKSLGRRVGDHGRLHDIRLDPGDDDAATLRRDIERLRADIKTMTLYQEYLSRRHAPYNALIRQRLREHNARFLAQFKPQPDLSRDELRAIIRIVEGTPQIQHGVLRVEVIDANNVQVTTGFIKGPLHGGGLVFHLRLNEKVWTVIKTTRWIS